MKHLPVRVRQQIYYSKGNIKSAIVYTLKSGITENTFTVEICNYDTGLGSLDRLHLTNNYDSVLGKRLERRETVIQELELSHRVKGDDFSLSLEQSGLNLEIPTDGNVDDKYILAY